MGDIVYQRKHLRAPFKSTMLAEFQKKLFTAKSLNLSEGGLLLQPNKEFHINEHIKVMLAIPDYPLFKNYRAQQLNSFNRELLHYRVCRLRAKVVRVQEKSFEMGLVFSEIENSVQTIINEYVEKMSANLIYLQVMIDAVNTQPTVHQAVRRIASFLGYPAHEKLSFLRQLIEQDYQSLRWG